VTWKKAKAEGFNSAQALEDYVRIHADPNAQATKLEEKGDVKAAFAGAAKTYHAEFRSDYGYHAQMEPLNAVVRINEAGDKAEVWEGSQAPDESRKAVAKALGLKDEQVDFHQCYMGGGFGRRSIGDYAAECARIAKEVRRPVKLIWTREEDIAQGMFRPQSFQCLEAATDSSGKVTGWKHCLAIAQALATAGIDHHARLGPESGSVNAPLLCGVGDKHLAHLRAGRAQLVEVELHRAAPDDPHQLLGTEGVLVAVDLRIGGGPFDRYLRPVGVHLLGNDEGQRGHGALAHFRACAENGDLAVRSDAHPRRDEGIGQGIGLRLRHEAHAVASQRDAEAHAAQTRKHAAAGDIGVDHGHDSTLLSMRARRRR
jgi:hypothetical protein